MEASAIIQSAVAPALVSACLEHFSAVATISHDEETGAGVAVSRFGTVRMQASPDGLSVDAESEDAIRLSYLKLIVAEYFLTHHAQEVGPVRWSGETAQQLPAFFRPMTVVSARQLTPHMRRLRLRGEGLDIFEDNGLHVRLLFAPSGRAPIWPSLGEDGRLIWPTGPDRLLARVYTLRSVDKARGEVEVDFVLHGDAHQDDAHEGGPHSPGNAFGAEAVAGDVVGMFAPGGDEIPDAGKLLLFGDDTALPAIARILEKLKPDARARVFAEIDGPEDHYDLPTGSNIEINWLYRNGREPGTAALLTEALPAVQADAQDEDAYIWVGCEFNDFKDIRRTMRSGWKIPRERHLVVAYWRRGSAGDDARQE